MGDGASIKRMALQNILAMCVHTPPIAVSIQDCTDHMQKGGKKDASYIAGLFEDQVIQYDPQKRFTDVFFFDGASNVQKAETILMTKFPRHFAFVVESMLYHSSYHQLPRSSPLKYVVEFLFTFPYRTDTKLCFTSC